MHVVFCKFAMHGDQGWHACSSVEASFGKVANKAMPSNMTPAVSHSAPLKVPVVCAMAPATTGAMIPAEPMYLILNTAISHRWGMPEPCDIAHCPMCWRCYDCTNPDCQCTLPDGMKGCKNLPAEMRIDYIRLYQDADNQKHTVGCSPPGYPTSEYIAAHQEDYAPWHATPQALILSDADRNIVLGLLAASSLALLGCCVWLILRVPAKKGAAAPTDRTRLIDPKGNSSGNSNRMRPIPTAHTSARDPEVHQYQKL